MKPVMRILAAIFILAQLFQPDRSVPLPEDSSDIHALIPVPENISQIIRASCYDCHSYQTHWPWYSYVTPLSWLVADDINKGRTKLNFSTWNHYDNDEWVTRFSQMASVISDSSMPLASYVITHSEAELNRQQRQEFSEWAEDQANRLSEESTERR